MTVLRFDSDSHSKDSTGIAHCGLSIGTKKGRGRTIKFGTSARFVRRAEMTPPAAGAIKISGVRPSGVCKQHAQTRWLCHFGHEHCAAVFEITRESHFGYQKNDTFCSININVGPGDCEWLQTTTCTDDAGGVYWRICSMRTLSCLSQYKCTIGHFVFTRIKLTIAM